MRRQPYTLTAREAAIIQRLIEGVAMKQIAAEAHMSAPKASSLVGRARECFGAENNEQLVAILFRRGLLQ